MRKIKTLSGVGLAVTLVGLPADKAVGDQAPASERVHIAVVADGPWGRFGDVPGTLEREIRALLSLDFEVTFARDSRFSGDWTPGGVRRAVDAALGDAEIDVVVTIGAIGSHLLAGRSAVPKPSVAALPTHNGSM